MKFDFSGYATRNDLKCSDGRTIRSGAFKDNDGEIVPLVWQHQHDDPGNVLGHAVLENRKDGVYAYAKFNDTPQAQNARELVKHGDVSSLSIFANKLVQRGGDVLHGMIREVSLVLTGANPGAYIDNVSMAHGEESDSEAIIYTGLENGVTIEHSDHGDAPQEVEEEVGGNTTTIGDVLEGLSPEQLEAVQYMVGSAYQDGANEVLEQYANYDNDNDNDNDNDDDNDEVEHSGLKRGGMRHNVFDNSDGYVDAPTLSHSEIQAICDDAQRCGSFRDAFLAHAQSYGIENIDVLFPDARAISNTPEFVKRRTEWVGGVINGTHHSPFSRIKTLIADITADEARAKGYDVKGKLKKEEVFKLSKRAVEPTTVYKKQKLDRDDVTDITTLDVVAWLKAEMRMMLDEEIARAILVGDGRSLGADDKINEEKIKPIWTDAELYCMHKRVPNAATTADIIDAFTRARGDYRGSGSPTLYIAPSLLTDMLLIKDANQRRIYATQAELASALRVSNIVEVPVLEGLKRTDSGKQYPLLGICVDLNDYTVGADQGGQVSMFDDFDIDYNQQKYLIETRISGMLVRPFSAYVLEKSPTV